MCLQCEVTDETNIISSASKMCIYANVANPVHQIFNVESPLAWVCNGNVYIYNNNNNPFTHNPTYEIPLVYVLSLVHYIARSLGWIQLLNISQAWKTLKSRWIQLTLVWFVCSLLLDASHSCVSHGRQILIFFFYFFKESLNCDEHRGEHI